MFKNSIRVEIDGEIEVFNRDVFVRMAYHSYRAKYPDNLDSAKTFTISDLTGVWSDCVPMSFTENGKEYTYMVDLFAVVPIIYGDYYV